MVAILLCRILWRSSAVCDSAIYRTAANTRIDVKSASSRLHIALSFHAMNGEVCRANPINNQHAQSLTHVDLGNANTMGSSHGTHGEMSKTTSSQYRCYRLPRQPDHPYPEMKDQVRHVHLGICRCMDDPRDHWEPPSTNKVQPTLVRWQDVY